MASRPVIKRTCHPALSSDNHREGEKEEGEKEEEEKWEGEDFRGSGEILQCKKCHQWSQ